MTSAFRLVLPAFSLLLSTVFHIDSLGEVIQPHESIRQGVGAVQGPVAWRDQLVSELPWVITHGSGAPVDYVPDAFLFRASLARAIGSRAATGAIA